MKPKRYLCPVCRKEVAITPEIKAMAEDLAANFFFVKLKGINLYCCEPVDYEWKLRYRGIIPVRVNPKSCT